MAGNNFAQIQGLMQQNAAPQGGPPPGGPMPGGDPSGGGAPPDITNQILALLQGAWMAGRQGVPFEQFIQKLMQEASGGGGMPPGGPAPGAGPGGPPPGPGAPM